MKKLDIKYYLLAFIETFSIWQMGIIFYSSKTLTVNNLIKTPVNLDNSILIIFIGYIIGIVSMYLFSNKTILLGRISIITSLFATILLFLPISPNLFSILYYLLTFNCVFFISINNSLIINYYSLKTALIDVISGTIIISLFIAICQNNIIPLSFNMFNIISTICFVLIAFALFKLPLDYNIKFITKEDKIKLASNKMFIGLLLVQFITCLLTLFTSSIAESIKNGVSVSYIGGFISGIIFLILYKKRHITPFRVIKYYFGITSIGFLLYLLKINNFEYLSLFLQGFNIFIIVALPFLMSNLFEIYPSKIIAPITTVMALLSVIVGSIVIEKFRDNPSILYSSYVFISILAIIIYLLIESSLELQCHGDETMFSRLTPREKDVAKLMIKGLTNKQIGKKLYLSEFTVKDHTKSIYKKYDVHSRIQLTKIIDKERD